MAAIDEITKHLLQYRVTFGSHDTCFVKNGESRQFPILKYIALMIPKHKGRSISTHFFDCGRVTAGLPHDAVPGGMGDGEWPVEKYSPHPPQKST